MDLQKKKLYVRLTFHTIAIVNQSIALIALANMDLDQMKNKPSYYLTNFKEFFFSGWNYALQFVFLLMALFCDLVKLSVQSDRKTFVSYDFMKNLATFRDYIFTTFVVPYTIFVTVAFWITYTTNRELVMPIDWDAVITPYMNHAMHTVIMIVIILEILIVTKKSPKNHKDRLVSLAIFTSTYYACFLGVYFVTGTWIYVLFNLFSWTERIVLLFSFYVSANIFYFIGWAVNDVSQKIWNHYENLEMKELKTKLT